MEVIRVSLEGDPIKRQHCKKGIARNSVEGQAALRAIVHFAVLEIDTRL